MKYLLILILLISGCNMRSHPSLNNCGLNFENSELTEIKNIAFEGSHGDSYVLNAFEYKKLSSGNLKTIKEKFISRGKIYIPATNDLDSLIGYNENHLCFIKDSSNNNFQACIVDTFKKIIVEYQVAN